MVRRRGGKGVGSLVAVCNGKTAGSGVGWIDSGVGTGVGKEQETETNKMTSQSNNEFRSVLEKTLNVGILVRT
jgi:hypothetical protein